MAEELNTAMLASDPDAVIPRLKLTENGVTGLITSNGKVIEEANRAFMFPQFIKIVEEMKNDPTVASCLLGYRTLIGRVDWTVEAPVGATPEQLERAKFIQTCMDDMEHSWSSFITEVLTYLEYGFSVHEKVFKRRLRRNGSKYDDGLIGWKKLAPRSQATIYKWTFSDDGRDLIGLEQDVSRVEGWQKYKLTDSNGKISIPREKFLLFSCDSTRDNPEGRSILKGAYTSYKRLDLIQNQQMIGVARDLGGVPVFKIPPKYMSPDASTEDKAVYDMFIKIGNQLTTGAQSSVVIPQMFDPDAKLPVFDFSLLESKGGKAYDIAAIIRQLQDDILAAMSCSVMKLQGNSGDSFSILEGGTHLMSLHLAYRCKEIAEVLNNDLIPATFALNGWTDTELPKFKFSDFDNISLEELSKYFQRIKAVGLIETDREVLNLVRTTVGLPAKPEDAPVDWQAIGGNSSKAGQGYATATGGLNGTGNSPPSQDNSANNMDNAA